MPLPRDPLCKQAGVNFTFLMPFSFVKILLMEVLEYFMLCAVHFNGVGVPYLLVFV
jgi:hypothetical protein